MKRGGPIPRRTPLRARRAIRRAPAHDLDDARAWRDTVLERAHHRCEACPRLREAERLPAPDEIPGPVWRRLIDGACRVARDCDGWATTAHHPEPRGMGGYGDNDPDTNPGVACCDRSHAYLESHRAMAEHLGLIRRHGKPRKGIFG